MTGEECALPFESEAADRALDGVGIDLCAAVVEEADEPALMVAIVAERVGQLVPLRDFGEIGSDPGPQGLDLGLRSLLTHGVAQLGRKSPDLGLDVVERKRASDPTCQGRSGGGVVPSHGRSF